MDFKVFTEAHIPENILYREEQINTINKSLFSFKEFFKGKNLIITGRSGTGKTTVIKSLMKTNGIEIRYASGIFYRRTHQILQKLSGIKSRNTDDLIERFLDDIRKNQKVLIIDEADLIVDRVSLMDWMNCIYRETLCPIFIVTNDLLFVSKLKDSVKSTLFFERVIFPVYETSQLLGILNDRLILLGKEIDEERKRFIVAAISWHGDGSARTLLQTTHTCFQEDNFSNEFILKTVKSALHDEFIHTAIENSTKTERRILQEIISYHDTKNPFDPLLTSSFLINKLDMGKSTMSMSLTNLEKLNLISTYHNNKGRSGGKIRVICLDELMKQKLKNFSEIFIG
jgi:Cdc6-like AAA superfamily ATPase